MKKRHLFWLVLVGLLCGCSNRSSVQEPERTAPEVVNDDYFISEDQAEEIASALPIEGELRLLATDKSVPGTRSTEAAESEYQPAYYLFAGERGGYAIIAATERAYPLLGYSESGKIDPNDLPCGLRMMLDIYAEQINTARALDIKPTTTRADVEPGSIVVEPLLGDIMWDQMDPFNGMTPGHAPTGCVATATAQIMRYWKYPDHAVGTHGYMSKSYGYLSHDYNYRIDWDDMPVAPNGTPDNKIDAKPNPTIARFMYGLGVAFDMNYSQQGSGTTHDKVVPALIRHYGYTKDIKRITAQEAGSQWSSIIKRELDARHPVLHGGTGKGGGHSFVCDGYTTDDLFHFNWGWSGVSNGWYKLNALVPDVLGTGGGAGGGYNENRDIVINIAPPARILGKNKDNSNLAEDDEQTDEDESTIIDNGVPYSGVRVFEPIDIFISYVWINGMSNPSAGEGYTLFNTSNRLISATAGKELKIKIETDRTNLFTSPVIGIYIDYNDNGVFYKNKTKDGKVYNDPDEKVYLGKVSLGTFDTTYTIPTTAAKGIHRLRIVLDDDKEYKEKKEGDFWATNPNAGGLIAGEVEDYFIEIK